MIDSSSQAPISPPGSRRWKLQIPIRLSRHSSTASRQQQSPRRGVFPTFCNRIKNYDDEGEEKKEETDESDDSTTSFEIESFPILMIPSSSMTTVTTTTASTENVGPLDDCCSVLVEPSSFANLSSFQMPSSIKKHQGFDHMDDSFRTEVTVSDELSLSDEDNNSTNDNPDIRFPPSSDSSSSSNSIDENEDKAQNSTSFQNNGGVRFADEIGLPMEHVLHYTCDREQREHSELLVLCICPEQKRFEFLHVGYHRHQENSNDDDDDDEEDDDDYADGDDNVIEILTRPTMNATKTTNVQDLLQGLPKMCTDSIFVNSTFDAIYRNNGVDKFFQKLEDWSVPLPECGFRENELLVVAFKGSSESDVLEGISPILSNDRIMKTLKRGRRSRRSLKFVRNSGRRCRVKQRWRRLKLPSSSSSSSSSSSIITTRKHNKNNNNNDNKNKNKNNVSSIWTTVYTKIGSTTSICVAGTFFITLCWKRDALMVSFFLGSILNAIFGKMLKRILKHDRPTTTTTTMASIPINGDEVIKEKEVEVEDSSMMKMKMKMKAAVQQKQPSRPSDNGMPSSHAMSLGFIFTFVALLIPNMTLPLLTYAVISLIYRIRVSLHSLDQIIVGSILGIFDGSIWWYLCQKSTTSSSSTFNIVDLISSSGIMNEHGLLPWYLLVVPALIGAAVVGSVERRLGMYFQRSNKSSTSNKRSSGSGIVSTISDENINKLD